MVVLAPHPVNIAEAADPDLRLLEEGLLEVAGVLREDHQGPPVGGRLTVPGW
jgi:hypothetical protein